MLKRIAIDDLRVGMYVEAVTKQKGALKIKTQGRVGSQVVIEKLKKQGILELAVHPQEEKPKTSEPKAETQPEPEKEKPLADPRERTRTFDQEIKQASKLYSQAKKFQKKAFADVKAGRKINAAEMEAVADGFIDSVFRNQDALACMTRIREKDAYLLEHSVNVSILMTILAKHMRLDKDMIHELATGALLHDIGKIKIDDKILHKPGRLNPQELAIMQSHVVHSKEILSAADNISSVSLDIASNHHERMDGSGYPNGSTGEDVSVHARMIAIVDAYDAMTADRCYKEGMNPINAFKLLMNASKTAYDGKIIQQFIQAVGVHPVGSLVLLKSGKLAIVTVTNFVEPLKPVVKVFYSTKSNHYTQIKDIDLAQSSERIESSVKPEKFNLDLSRFFKEAILH